MLLRALGVLLVLSAIAAPAASAHPTGTWTGLPNSGTARQEVSYVQTGGKFYLAGGTGTTLHQAYNPQTQTWSTLAPLPAALDHIQGVAYGGKIYYIGGLVTWPQPHVSTVYIYDPATNTFSQGASMGARGRGAGGVALYKDKIYYAGGLHDGVAVNWFDVYDPKANTWTQLPNMPTARDHFHGVVLDDQFWAIGGRDKEINLTKTANESYNFKTGNWVTTHAALPTPRGGFGAATQGDEIFIIGGEDATEAHHTVEAYNVKTNTWREMGDMPTARHGIQAATCNGGIYIAGGGTEPSFHPTNVHEAFFPDGAVRPCGGTVSFSKKKVAGVTPGGPTSMQWGPDGRLYVAAQSGIIRAYTISRSADGDYDEVSTEQIDLVNQMQNRDDDGTDNNTVHGRLVTGILIRGTPTQPVIYVASSDPRIGAGEGGSDINLDTNSGIISKLTKTGPSWSKQDLVRGLPRSEENHTTNGLALSEDGQTLYVAQGGNTNKGSPSANFALLPEYALSAAVLSVDLQAIGSTTYDLPTLDDPSRLGMADPHDPFGGNDGANQAKLVSGGPVQVYAPGFRNPYDVILTASGEMYTIDNGGNAGWGDFPQNSPAGTCTNAQREPGGSDRDGLHHITGAGYYGGHPNPTRGNKSNTFGGQTPIEIAANPVECEYRSPGQADGSGNTAGTLVTFPTSTNGLAEYTASNFGGAMQGDLVTAGLDNVIYRIAMASPGAATKSTLVSSAGGGGGPLDITTIGDDGPFPGTIWYGDLYEGGESVYVLEPGDYDGGSVTCDLANNDADGDGFTNGDEVANGTDPCSAADFPPDADGDDISDKTDPDDDNDTIADVDDAFARDANNGLSTNMPVDYQWENDSPSPGGLLNLGFTGLMRAPDGSNYLDQFDRSKMTTGGAAGVVTVDEVDEGDAFEGFNTQRYGFQFGVKARPADGSFLVHSVIEAPFAGITPADYQSMGIFIGTGDQDNYVKLVTGRNGSTRVESLPEFNDDARFDLGGTTALSLPGPGRVDLYLAVDPVAKTVQPSFTSTTGSVTTARQNVGPPITVPDSWFTAVGRGLAVGIISTSNGPGQAFPASWDFLKVTRDSAPPVDEPPSAPAGLTAAAGDNRVELDWDDNGESDLAGYRVFRSSGGAPVQIHQGPTSSFVDAGVDNDTTYTYTVKAYDDGGHVSAASAGVQATPRAPVVTEPTADPTTTPTDTATPTPTASVTPGPTVEPPPAGKMTMKVKAAKLRKALKKGLALEVACPASCRLTARLQLPAKAARKLSLGRKATYVARGTLRMSAAGKKTLRVKFTRAAKKRLAKLRRVSLVLVLSADQGGKRTKSTRKVRLKR